MDRPYRVPGFTAYFLCPIAMLFAGMVVFQALAKGGGELWITTIVVGLGVPCGWFLAQRFDRIYVRGERSERRGSESHQQAEGGIAHVDNGRN